MYMHNKYILPGNLIDPNEIAEKILVQTILPKYLNLKLRGKINKGNKTAILISNTNGSGIHSNLDHFYHFFAGLQYEQLCGRKAKIFDSATSTKLREVIQDSDFENIFLIGHASYHSWRASDKSVDWFSLALMTGDHLKKGIFANVGCGGIHSANMIPLGYFVVSDPKTLIGYEAEYSYADSLGDFSKLKPLKRMPSFDDLLNM